ncbi:MAG: phosphate ABC transporter permease subunit PstC [Actinobacteria bacterium]|nr:phosphate ABC transporter permease subunit PstC [Actinomycetota bacterium]
MSSVASTVRSSRSERRGVRRLLASDTSYRGVLRASGVLFLIVLAGLIVVIVQRAWPAFQHFGPGFVTGQTWDPVHVRYGALPYIVGTLFTAAVAILIALPIGVGTAIFLAELAPRWSRGPVSTLVELLAAVPSVVFGLWGLLAVAPWVSAVLEPRIQQVTHSFVIFRGAPLGVGVLLASLILAAMVIPTIAAISRDVLAAVPDEQKEAAMALGATRWQMVRKAMLPVSLNGVLGATTLALGRALGETMAVTMVIGNKVGTLPDSLFSPANTIASVIANEFTEATEPFHLSSLLALAAILLVISLLVNILARGLVWSVGREQVGADLL